MAVSPLSDTKDFGPIHPAPLAPVDVAALSHAGHVRRNNEDHFLIVRFGRYLEPLQTNLPADHAPGYRQEMGYAMVVADGMGGHAAGEVASRLAVGALVELALATPDWILRLDDPLLGDEVLRRASDRLQRVDQELAGRARADSTLHGFGTTMTYAASLGRDLFVAHVGDSRAYLCRGVALRRLTRDHTLAQSMADAGTIRQEEVARHRFNHVLTRVLGHAALTEPDVCRESLEDNDLLLLCSDGLTDMVGDDEIAEVLGSAATAREACEQLVGRALRAGGRDNVTAVVARYAFPLDAPAATSATQVPA